jgi:V8-like Glu-specific endopeptidase
MHSGVYALFSDQIVADLKSQGGDSGSLVLNEQNEAVGLLFAGSDRSTILNRIQNVMDKLNITF